jgi:hypothetical protein
MLNGLALTPFFMMGLALTPGLFLGACTYPLFDYGACALPPFENLATTKKKEKHHNHRGDTVAHLSTMKLMVSKLQRCVSATSPNH